MAQSLIGRPQAVEFRLYDLTIHAAACVAENVISQRRALRSFLIVALADNRVELGGGT